MKTLTISEKNLISARCLQGENAYFLHFGDEKMLSLPVLAELTLAPVAFLKKILLSYSYNTFSSFIYFKDLVQAQDFVEKVTPLLNEAEEEKNDLFKNYPYIEYQTFDFNVADFKSDLEDFFVDHAELEDDEEEETTFAYLKKALDFDLFNMITDDQLDDFIAFHAISFGHEIPKNFHSRLKDFYIKMVLVDGQNKYRVLIAFKN